MLFHPRADYPVFDVVIREEDLSRGALTYSLDAVILWRI
jgi:hypothetical protein